MKNLEQNYISVVLVVNDEDHDVISKVQNIRDILSNNFKGSEIVIVDNTIKSLELNTLSERNVKYTLIKLPIKHNTQQALNAGTAMAIGDYIIEIEDVSFEVDYSKIIELYKESQKGYDFVFLKLEKE